MIRTAQLRFYQILFKRNSRTPQVSKTLILRLVDVIIRICHDKSTQSIFFNGPNP